MSVLTSVALQELFEDHSPVFLRMQNPATRAWAEAHRGELVVAAREQRGTIPAPPKKPGRQGPRFAVEPRFFQRKMSPEVLDELVGQTSRLQVQMVGASGAWAHQDDDGGYRIQVPQRGLNLGLLRMIAHEMGHVRFESSRDQKPQDPAQELVLSEVAALKAERSFVRAHASDAEFAQYLEFQRQWLRVNTWAHAWERQELHQGHAQNRPVHLWLLEWASARVGFTEIMITATRLAFPELKGS